MKKKKKKKSSDTFKYPPFLKTINEIETPIKRSRFEHPSIHPSSVDHRLDEFPGSDRFLRETQLKSTRPRSTSSDTSPSPPLPYAFNSYVENAGGRY